MCPFMMDQFYWAERMFWLGVGPEPLKRHHLVPDEVDEKGIKEAANIIARAIDYALSPEVKARASEVAEKLSLEVIMLTSRCNFLVCIFYTEELIYLFFKLILSCNTISFLGFAASGTCK